MLIITLGHPVYFELWRAWSLNQNQNQNQLLVLSTFRISEKLMIRFNAVHHIVLHVNYKELRYTCYLVTGM